jgi:hypothetical protein
VAASIAGHLFRLVPYGRRLKAALAVSRLVTRRYRSSFETDADARARIVLRSLGYANVPFANDVIVRGKEELHAPAIIVSTHLFLNAMLLRALIEDGQKLAIFRATPADPPCLIGSRIPLENLLTTSTIFLTMRRRMAEGEIAFLNIDGPPRPTRWQANGTYLSDAAVAFALRMNVPLFFAATRVDGRRIVAELRRARGETVDAVMEELLAFLKVV